jgi:hypothetical protein
MMFRRRIRWEWYGHEKVLQELNFELSKARTPEALKGELASALLCLCTKTGQAPAELPPHGPIRVLRVSLVEQRLFIFFAAGLACRCYIGLHALYIENVELPTPAAYTLAKARLESFER